MPLSIIVMLQASIVLLAQTETIGARKQQKFTSGADASEDRHRDLGSRTMSIQLVQTSDQPKCSPPVKTFIKKCPPQSLRAMALYSCGEYPNIRKSFW